MTMRRRLGKHMRNAHAFALRNPGWQTFKIHCKKTRMAIARLVRNGDVEVNDCGQFRAKTH